MARDLARCGRCHRETTTIPPAINLPVETRFLRFDYALTDIEIIQTKLLLDEEVQALAIYDRDLADLRQMLGDLEVRKLALEQINKQRRATISIQRRVPAELWKTIFSLVCSSSTEGGYAFVLEHLSNKPQILNFPPIILSHVCSHWRNVVNSSPELWSSLKVNLSCLPQYSPALLELCLTNSGQHALDITIKADDPVSGNPYSRLRPDTWSTLMRDIHRCKLLRCSLKKQSFKFPERPFPNLITLDDSGCSLSFRQFRSGLFQDAPKLTEVSTSHLYHLSHLPYSQLTSLTCRCLPLGHLNALVREILPSCNRLEFLTLELDGENDGEDDSEDESDDDSNDDSEDESDDDGEGESGDDGEGESDDSEDSSDEAPPGSDLRRNPRVELPHLKTLAIERQTGCIASTIIGVIFAPLVAPSLQTLQLHYAECCNEGWDPSFFRLLTQSGSLQHLSLQIDHHTPAKASMATLLEALPHLTRFEVVMQQCFGLQQIYQLGITSRPYRELLRGTFVDLFRSLEVPPDAPSGAALVPKLTNLGISVTVAELDDEMLNHVLDAVESRRSIPASVDGVRICPLEAVRLVCSRVPPIDGGTGEWSAVVPAPEGLARIESLARVGSKVSIRCL